MSSYVCRRRFLWCAALLVTGLGLAQQRSALPVFRSEANLVILDVQALHGSEPVAGLQPSDLRITDDGRERAIKLFEYAGAPLDLVFVLDISEGIARTSAPEWYPSLRRALLNIRPGDRVGIVTFAADTVVHSRLTANENEWDDAIENALTLRQQRRSKPNLYGALLEASTLFDEPESFRRRVALLVSHNMGEVDRNAVQVVVRRYSSVGITLQMLVVPTHEVPAQRRWGVGSVLNRHPTQDPMPPVIISEKQKPRSKRGPVQPDRGTADPIVDATGGEVFRYREDYETDPLREAVRRLRNRYLIGFVVPEEEYTEGWHQISVHLSWAGESKYPALRVRASRAYYVVRSPDDK
jgi:VWFA-related protein